MKIKAALVIQRFWRGIRTRQLYFKLRGIKAVQQLNRQIPGKQGVGDIDHKFYRESLKGYIPRFQKPTSSVKLTTFRQTNPGNVSFSKLAVSRYSCQATFKKPSYLRQVTLARNKRARAIDEK